MCGASIQTALNFYVIIAIVLMALYDKMNQSFSHQSDLFTGHHGASCTRYRVRAPLAGEKIFLEIKNLMTLPEDNSEDQGSQ